MEDVAPYEMLQTSSQHNQIFQKFASKLQVINSFSIKQNSKINNSEAYSELCQISKLKSRLARIHFCKKVQSYIFDRALNTPLMFFKNLKIFGDYFFKIYNNIIFLKTYITKILLPNSYSFKNHSVIITSSTGLTNKFFTLASLKLFKRTIFELGDKL